MATLLRWFQTLPGGKCCSTISSHWSMCTHWASCISLHEKFGCNRPSSLPSASFMAHKKKKSLFPKACSQIQSQLTTSLVAMASLHFQIIQLKKKSLTHHSVCLAQPDNSIEDAINTSFLLQLPLARLRYVLSRFHQAWAPQTPTAQQLPMEKHFVYGAHPLESSNSSVAQPVLVSPGQGGRAPEGQRGRRQRQLGATH